MRRVKEGPERVKEGPDTSGKTVSAPTDRGFCFQEQHSDPKTSSGDTGHLTGF